MQNSSINHNVLSLELVQFFLLQPSHEMLATKVKGVMWIKEKDDGLQVSYALEYGGLSDIFL